MDLRARPGGPGASVPWPADAVGRLVVSNMVGLAVILASAYEASHEHVMRSSLTWLNLAVLGLAIAGAGNALWVLRGRQALASARGAAFAELHLPVADDPPSVVEGDQDVVAIPGLRRFHRPDCAFVAGRATELVTPAVRGRDGLLPCEICQPEGDDA
jgi:hypothetical protein